MDITKFLTIQQIAIALNDADGDRILRKKHLFAVILDAARPRKLGTNDYIQTIKVVDGSQPGYLTVFLFSKHPEELAPIDTIGDVVFLKRFMYKQFNGEPQARHNSFKTSQFLQFNGFTEDIGLRYNPNNAKPLNSLELQFLDNMKKFAHEFYSHNSLLSLSWYGCTQSSIYDLLMKVSAITDVVELLDPNNQVYTLDSQVLREVPVGSLVKLRSVQVQANHQIIINESSSVLLVPEYSYDTQHYNTLNQQIKYIDPKQDEYVQHTINSISLIKQKHNTLMKSTLSQVKHYNRPDKRVFLVNAELVTITPMHLHQAIILYNTTTSMSLQQALDNHIDPITFEYTLQLQIQLTDNTLDVSEPALTALVYKCSFMQLLNQLTLHNVDEYRQPFEKIVTEIALSDVPVYVDLVLEVQQILDQQIIRVIDTQLK